MEEKLKAVEPQRFWRVSENLARVWSDNKFAGHPELALLKSFSNFRFCQVSNFAMKNFRFLFRFWLVWVVPCGSPLIEGKFIYCRSYLFPTPLLFSPALTFWTLKVEGVGGGFQPGLINSQRPCFQQIFLEKMSGATGAESLGVTFFSKATVRHEMSGNGFPSSLCALSLIDYHLWQRHSPVLYLCNSYNAVSSHWSHQNVFPLRFFFFF